MTIKNNVPYDADLIGLIYDTSLDPAFWPQLIDGINEILESSPDESGHNFKEAIVKIGNQDFDVHSSEKKLFNIISPHLKRAIQLKNNYQSQSEEKKFYSSLLDNLPVGLILTDKNLKVILTNKLVKRILEDLDSIFIEESSIRFEDYSLKRQFEEICSKLNIESGQSKYNSYSLNIVTNKQRILILLTNRLSFTDTFSNVEDYIAILFAPANLQQEINESVLSSLFGLTKAEARLAGKLANGLSIEDVAEKLHLSKHTLRSQLKTIFRKTNTTRQTELVKFILTSPAVFTHKEPIDFNSNSADGQLIDFNSPRLNQKITLNDNRILGFAEYGPENGQPVFFLHSVFGCRYEVPDLPDVLEKLNIRLIVPDRPGYGLSDNLNERSIMQWSDDFIQLYKSVNVNKIPIIGYSMGGPYAIACAIKYPDLVSKVVLVSSAYQVKKIEDLDGMLPSYKFLLGLCRFAPSIAKKFYNSFFIKLAKKDTEKFRYNIIVDEQERSVVEQTFVRIVSDKCVDELVNVNSEGSVQDMLLSSRLWGFDIEDVAVPMEVWHGENDKHTPKKQIELLTEGMSGCQSFYFKNEGHMVIFSHWEEILGASIGL